MKSLTTSTGTQRDLRHFKVRRVAATAAVIGLLCAGCSGASTSSSSTSVATASAASLPTAAGLTIEGTGYAFTAPEGLASQDFPGSDSAAVDLQDKDGFSDNVNVNISTAGPVTPEQVEGSIAEQMSAAGFKDVVVGERAIVGGEEAGHLTATVSLNDNENKAEQFYVPHGDQTFVVTFSFSTSVTPEERSLLASSVLDTWTWTE